jgi:hypothetical protein
LARLRPQRFRQIARAGTTPRSDVPWVTHGTAL